MRLYALLLVLLTGLAQAATTPLIVTCTTPTQNTDSTPLTDLKQYNLFYSSCNNGVFVEPPLGSVVSTNVAVCGVTVPALAVGTYCVYMTATRVANNATSARSNTAVGTVSATPNPPGNVSVAIATVAFAEKVVPWGTQLVRLSIEVPLGTPCTTPVCGWPKKYRYVPSIISDQGLVVAKCSVPT